MRKILLTGATGLIGSRLVSMFPKEAEVFNLGRHMAHENSHWLSADLEQPLNVQLLPTNVDTVVYLAQSEHFRDFPARAQSIFSVNVANVQVLLDWASRSGVSRFVLASSGGVYGSGPEAFSEDHPLSGGGQLGYYLATKHCAERLAESYSALFTTVIVRPFFVYGPKQRASMLIPRLIRSVKNGDAIQLHGENGIRINPIYVDDAAAVILRCCDLQQSQIINVAGEEILSLRELALLIGSIVDREPLFEVQNTTAKDLVANTTKMKNLLNHSQMTLAQGIASMIMSL